MLLKAKRVGERFLLWDWTSSFHEFWVFIMKRKEDFSLFFFFPALILKNCFALELFIMSSPKISHNFFNHMLGQLRISTQLRVSDYEQKELKFWRKLRCTVGILQKLAKLTMLSEATASLSCALILNSFNKENVSSLLLPHGTHFWRHFC